MGMVTGAESPSRGIEHNLVEYWVKHSPRLLAAMGRRLPTLLVAIVDASDIVQEAYLDAAKKWAAFLERHPEGPEPSVYGWLYRISLDRLITLVRHHSRRIRDRGLDQSFPDISSAQLGLGLVASGQSPSSLAIANESRERMERALDQLSHEDRDVLWRLHIDRLSLSQLAESLGITPNTAAQRYRRAHQKYRELRTDIESGDRSRS